MNDQKPPGLIALLLTLILAAILICLVGTICVLVATSNVP